MPASVCWSLHYAFEADLKKIFLKLMSNQKEIRVWTNSDKMILMDLRFVHNSLFVNEAQY